MNTLPSMRIVGAFLSFLASVSLAGAATPRPGNWGGVGIRMLVRAHSTHIEFDCAEGLIQESIKLNRNLQFDVSGSIVLQGPGPIGPTPPPVHQARYFGNLHGKVMHITVVIVDTGETIGTFSAVLGGVPVIRKCL